MVGQKLFVLTDKEGVYVDIGSSFEVLLNGADMPEYGHFGRLLAMSSI